MKKKLDTLYLSLFAISDMAIQFKADSQYTQSVIENILFFAWSDGLINGHQYDEMAKQLNEDLEGFHSLMFKLIKFD